MLSRSADSYRRAHQRHLERQGFDPYPVLNWLTAATLLDQHVPDADALIERCKATACERFSTDHEFWRAIALADAELLRALMAARLGQDGEDADDEVVRLQTIYQEVIRETAPTARDLDSVARQIDITGKLLQKLLPDRPATTATTARLAELRRRITGDARSV